MTIRRTCGEPQSVPPAPMASPRDRTGTSQRISRSMRWGTTCYFGSILAGVVTDAGLGEKRRCGSLASTGTEHAREVHYWRQIFDNDRRRDHHPAGAVGRRSIELATTDAIGRRDRSICRRATGSRFVLRRTGAERGRRYEHCMTIGQSRSESSQAPQRWMETRRKQRGCAQGAAGRRRIHGRPIMFVEDDWEMGPGAPQQLNDRAGRKPATAFPSRLNEADRPSERDEGRRRTEDARTRDIDRWVRPDLQ